MPRNIPSMGLGKGLFTSGKRSPGSGGPEISDRQQERGSSEIAVASRGGPEQQGQEKPTNITPSKERGQISAVSEGAKQDKVEEGDAAGRDMLLEAGAGQPLVTKPDAKPPSAESVDGLEAGPSHHEEGVAEGVIEKEASPIDDGDPVESADKPVAEPLASAAELEPKQPLSAAGTSREGGSVGASLDAIPPKESPVDENQSRVFREEEQALAEKISLLLTEVNGRNSALSALDPNSETPDPFWLSSTANVSDAAALIAKIEAVNINQSLDEQCDALSVVAQRLKAMAEEVKADLEDDSRVEPPSALEQARINVAKLEESAARQEEMAKADTFIFTIGSVKEKAANNDAHKQTLLQAAQGNQSAAIELERVQHEKNEKIKQLKADQAERTESLVDIKERYDDVCTRFKRAKDAFFKQLTENCNETKATLYEVPSSRLTTLSDVGSSTDSSHATVPVVTDKIESKPTIEAMLYLMYHVDSTPDRAMVQNLLILKDMYLQAKLSHVEIENDIHTLTGNVDVGGNEKQMTERFLEAVCTSKLTELDQKAKVGDSSAATKAARMRLAISCGQLETLIRELEEARGGFMGGVSAESKYCAKILRAFSRSEAANVSAPTPRPRGSNEDNPRSRSLSSGSNSAERPLASPVSPTASLVLAPTTKLSGQGGSSQALSSELSGAII